MPIEIKELVLRVRIDEKTQNQQEVKLSTAQKEQLVKECTERAIKQIERKMKSKNFV